MLKHRSAFSGFSAKDLDAEHAFYGETLGVDVTREEMGVLALTFAGGHRVMIYPKDDHQPAAYTVLNFEVDDIEAAVDALTSAGVRMERYGDEFGQDERGIARGWGPPIAWFKDPAGNILSVIQAS